MNLEALTPEIQSTIMGILLFSALFALANYIVTGFAIYNISKVENVNNPWLAWIPIGNFYQLIKLGKGNYIFLIALIGVMAFGSSNNGITSILGLIFSIVYSGYSIYMYSKLCDKYDVNIFIIGIGILAPIFILVKSLGGFLIPVLVIGMYGQFKLARNAKKPRNENERVIETRVVGRKNKKKK